MVFAAISNIGLASLAMEIATTVNVMLAAISNESLLATFVVSEGF